jgi:hypothetical protein
MAFVAIVVAMAIVAYAVAFWPRDDDDDEPPEGSPAALVGEVAAGSLIVDVSGATTSGSGREPLPSIGPRPTPPEVVGSPPASTDASFQAECEVQCLVRLTESRKVNAALAEREHRAAFAAGGSMWAGLSAADIDTMRADGFNVAIVDPSPVTLDLYAVRTPPDADDGPVRDFGEIIDEVGNQYIVRVPRVPAEVTTLTNLGIWVEKFPPLPPADIQALGDEELDSDLLWQLSGMVGNDNLLTTATALQRMGAAEGETVGSRYYESPGNVMAAEYLYQRFEAYGLTVSYQDFISDNGLLTLNVVAELPGRDPSQMFVIIGHFDSMNSATVTGAAPGADDNATGVAGMLEIARVLSGYELEHPVTFFATNAEEVGLQGVQALASRAAKSGQTITAAFNLDAIGSPFQGSQIILNADGDSLALRDLLIDVNDDYGLGQNFLLPKDPKEVISDDTVMRDWGFPTVLIARELFGWGAIHHSAEDIIGNVDYYNVRMATELTLITVATLLTESNTPDFDGS